MASSNEQLRRRPPSSNELMHHIERAAKAMVDDFSNVCFGSPKGTLYYETKCTCIKKWLEEESKETIIQRLTLTFLEFSMTAAEQAKKKKHHRRLVEAMRGFKFPYVTIPPLDDFQKDDKKDDEYDDLDEPTGTWYVCQNAMLSFVVRLPEHLKKKNVAFHNISVACMELEEGYRFRAQGRIFFRAATKQRAEEWEERHHSGKNLKIYFEWKKVKAIMQKMHSQMLNQPQEANELNDEEASDNSSNNRATVVSNAGTTFSGKSNMSQKSEVESLDFIINGMDSDKMSKYYKKRNFHHLIPLHEYAVLHDVNPIRGITDLDIPTPKQLMDLCGAELITLDSEEKAFCAHWGTLVPGGGEKGTYARTARNSTAHNVVYTLLGGNDFKSALLSADTPPKIRKFASEKDNVPIVKSISQKIKELTERVMIKNGHTRAQAESATTLDPTNKETRVQYRFSHVVTKNHNPQSPHHDYTIHDKTCYHLWTCLSGDGLILELFPKPGVGRLANILFGQIMMIPDKVPYSSGLSFDNKGHICVHAFVIPDSGTICEDKTEEMDPNIYIHHPQLAKPQYFYRCQDSYKGYTGPKIEVKPKHTGPKIKYHLGTTFFGNNYDTRGIQFTPSHKENTQRRKEEETLFKLGVSPFDAENLVAIGLKNVIDTTVEIGLPANEENDEEEPDNEEQSHIEPATPSVAATVPNMWGHGEGNNRPRSDPENANDPSEQQRKRKRTAQKKTS